MTMENVFVLGLNNHKVILTDDEIDVVMNALEMFQSIDYPIEEVNAVIGKICQLAEAV